MADFTRPPADHRKLAFPPHASWPTPPTEVENDFSQNMGNDKSMIRLPSLKEGDQIALASIPALHSPPASPAQGWTEKLPPIQSPAPMEAEIHMPLPPIKDRQLFSEANVESQEPLFHPSQEERADSLSPVDRAKSPSELGPKKASFNGIYSIFPQFQGADREFFRKYRQSCYKEVMRIPAWRPLNNTQPAAVSVTHSAVAAPPPPAARPFKVTKSREIHVRAKPVQARPKIPRVSTAASPVAKTLKTPTKRERQSASVEPQARKRAPPSKPVVADNWLEIADYSPSTTTLDTMSQRLKVHWKGVPNDLSSDPEIKHLHAQEVDIAQELKLPANQYLANKRRIFEARLRSIKDHKNFTKTAAQQACNIDVNKTSQLYEAYEKIGWFDETNFKQWLV